MITAEKTQLLGELWRVYRQNRHPLVRDKLVREYLPLVKYVAGRVAIGLPAHVDKEDLLSNGYIGLIDAIEKFDITKGVKFETYAVTRIRGSIIDSLRALDWVPVSLRQKARKVQDVLHKLENELGRAPSNAEVAAELAISEKDLNTLFQQLNSCTLVPLDDMIKSDGRLTGKEEDDPLKEIEETELKAILGGAIDRLPEKERLVVALYYYEDLTLKEISQVLGVTEARVSQLHTKAILRLRGSLSKYKQHIL